MEHGKITTVEFQDGIVYCNVRPVRYNVLYEGLPVLKSHSGFVELPKQGDTAIIDELDDGSKFITNFLSNEEVHSEPNALPAEDEIREGDLTLRLDKQTQLTFSKANSGGYNIDISSSKNVNIESDGDVSIKSDGNINIQADENINLEAKQNINIDSDSSVKIQGVPFLDHKHSYSDSTISDTDDGSGTESTESKDTGTPKQ